jgi:hypothetical protein
MTGRLLLTKILAIEGLGANQLEISGHGSSAVFAIRG